MAYTLRTLSALTLLSACTPPGTGPDESSGTTKPGPESESVDADPTDPSTPTTSSSSTSTGPDTATDTTIADDTTMTTMVDPTTTGEPACGDGLLAPDEVCDDGNIEDGDCCSADCQVGPSEPGQVCWTEIIEGNKNGGDQGLGVVLDGDDEIYILATVLDSVTQADILIRKYDPGPFSQWTQQYDGGINGSDAGFALAGDAAGFMVALGRQTVAMGQPGVLWLSKCTPTGQVVWATTETGSVNGSDIALAGDGGDFVVVGVIKQADNDALVRKYADGGQELWSEVFTGAGNGPDTASGVAVDGAGNILAVGREFTDLENFNIWIQQYGPDGTPGWGQSFDGGAAGNDWANAVAFDDAGDAVVVGRIDVGGGFSDAWIRKLADDGSEVWTQTIAGELGESDEAIAVAVGSNGDIAVVGKSAVLEQGLDIFVHKLDADGETLWARTHGAGAGEDDDVGDVAVGSDGSVIVIGTEVVVPTINSDVWLRKYSP
jgi:cysteine-rich repeat protein